MTDDDVDAVLASLEERLRSLQAELDDDEPLPAPGGTVPPERRGTVPASAPEHRANAPEQGGTVPPEQRGTVPSEPGDPLERFGDDLRRAARDLVSAYDRALADARGTPAEGPLFRDEVVLEVAVGLRGLCELDRALATIPGVADVQLRAYAGGHAALDLTLDRAVPLVEALRSALPVPVAVVEARHGRLAVELAR